MAKKIDKEFVLSDSSVNCYGFRLLTGGYRMEEYKKNPIGYIMHDRDKGVAVRWEDLRVQGDQVVAKPVINLAYPNAQNVIDSIESGFLNAASVGHIVALEVSNEATLKLPGQEGPTVTKWYNRECSLVDIPGNFNALRLYDKNDNEIAIPQLASLAAPQHGQKREHKMKPIQLQAAQLAALQLPDEADESAVAKAIDALAARAQQVSQLEAAVLAKEKELTALKNHYTQEAVERLINEALSAKKVTVEAGAQLKAKFAGDPDGLSDLLQVMPAYVPLSEQGKGVTEGEGKALAAQSYDELMESGEMATVKAKYPALYEEKLKAIKHTK